MAKKKPEEPGTPERTDWPEDTLSEISTTCELAEDSRHTPA